VTKFRAPGYGGSPRTRARASKNVRGMVDVNLSDFFTLSGSSIRRGHCYKICFHHCRVNARLNFFSNRVMTIFYSFWPYIRNGEIYGQGYY